MENNGLKRDKEQYVKDIISNQDELELKLSEILNKYNITSFYKYVSGAEYDVENFLNNKILASKTNWFNDPFEFMYYVESRNNIDIVHELINTKDRFYVSCLSERNDSILMWSHYANFHRGFVIEYDAIDLCNMYFNELLPVIYSKERVKLNFNIEELFHSLLVKYDEWSYEQEWRIIKSENKEEKYDEIALGRILIDVPTPKAIYLGCRFDENPNKDMILEKIDTYCRDNAIKINKVKEDNIEFKLNIYEGEIINKLYVNVKVTDEKIKQISTLDNMKINMIMYNEEIEFSNKSSRDVEVTKIEIYEYDTKQRKYTINYNLPVPSNKISARKSTKNMLLEEFNNLDKMYRIFFKDDKGEEYYEDVRVKREPGEKKIYVDNSAAPKCCE